MSQKLIASTLIDSNSLGASDGETLLSAVQQLSGYVTRTFSFSLSSPYGYYSINTDNFMLPAEGDGVFRAYLESVSNSQSTPCGNLYVIAHPEVCLYIGETLRVTLTSTSTSPNWYSGIVTSDVLATVTSVNDFQVRVYPKFVKDDCVDTAPDPQESYMISASGKIMYFELEIPDGPFSLEMGCAF